MCLNSFVSPLSLFSGSEDVKKLAGLCTKNLSRHYARQLQLPLNLYVTHLFCTIFPVLYKTKKVISRNQVLYWDNKSSTHI